MEPVRERGHLRTKVVRGLLVCMLVGGIPACGGKGERKEAGETDTLVLAAYTVPKEAYEKEIIPAFQDYWMEKMGRRVVFEQSYEASGAQARAVVGGFEADVVALSLEGDVKKVVDAGLITHDWKERAWNGFITRSVVVIGFRAGNPKNIRGWEDLTRPGVDVLYPNPKTSGGAMWCVNAVYGAGLKMSEAATGRAESAAGRRLLKDIQRRVKVMDKSGRLSVTTYERGIGDAILTYENEALLRKLQGREFPFIIPDATILIENPVAVVDRNAEKHGVREIAEAFVQFLHTDQAQRTYARYGFRPASPTVLEEFADQYPAPPMLFDIEYLGGWTDVRESIYGSEGVWTQITRELAEEG